MYKKNYCRRIITYLSRRLRVWSHFETLVERLPRVFHDRADPAQPGRVLWALDWN